MILLALERTARQLELTTDADFRSRHHCAIIVPQLLDTFNRGKYFKRLELWGGLLVSYNDDNQGGFGARHFDQLGTSALQAASESLQEVNQRISEFSDTNQGDIRDTCLQDIQAIESVLGPLFDWYQRDGDKVNCTVSTQDFAFIGQMLRIALKVMERYCDAMANTRGLASQLENLVNIITERVNDAGEPDFEIFSQMIDGGQKADLVEMVSEALQDITDPNTMKLIVEQAADMALVSTHARQHHTQREVVDMTNSHINARITMKSIADNEAKRVNDAKASSGNPNTPRKPKPAWLTVVEGSKE